MSFTTPKTWAYKETLSSSDMNTYIKDNINALRDGTGFADNVITPSSLKFSGAKARHAITQALSDATFTPLSFTSEDYDTDSYHDISSNSSRLTVPATGKYRIGATVGFAANSTGDRILLFQINGGATGRFGYQVADSTTTLNHFLTTTVDLELSSGDYVEAIARQSSGGDLNTVADTGIGNNGFWIQRIA